MAVTPDKTPGSFGQAPADAPREVTTPGSERPTASQIAQARANEQDLPVYAPKPMTDAMMASFLGKSVEEIQAMRVRAGELLGVPAAPASPAPPVVPAPLVDPTGRPVSSLRLAPAKPAPVVVPVPVEATSEPVAEPVAAPIVEPAPEPTPAAGSLAAAARAVHTRPPVTAAEPYRPAASDTDSPARGLPTAIPDPGKQITGGFGDLGEAQYFPLDGLEAGRVASKLLQAILDRIPDDLRFSLAATYPRVRIRAMLEVECFAADHSFQIVKIQVPPHEKTPLDVARQYGDQVVFCLVEQHVEMTEAGESITPPNAARQDLGLPIPRKRAVDLPGKRGRLLVDVTS